MDYLEPGSMRELKLKGRAFLKAPEEESLRLSVIDDIEMLIEVSEQNRRKQ